ncbi:endonuclease III [Bacteroidia bacterium]|nr:endonuclease III [Bacteroidia bacterium]GHV46245.1 endonuclease III [Bacteroidia bacterium]
MNKNLENIIAWFEKEMPHPSSELCYETAYQLLVAVILSAQCTDKRVNMTTPDFFAAFPDADTLANATEESIYQKIKSISYPNNKAKNLLGMAKMLTVKFGGIVPSDVDLLQELPGVGRKTANVIASVFFNKSVLAVDTHVFRVAARLGFTKNAKTPLETEKILTSLVPPDKIPNFHHWMILHGRYVCTARSPKCSQCGIRQYCDFGQNNGQ